MTNLSVSVPQELRQRMAKLDEVNWSAVARKAFEEKVQQIEFMKSIANRSKLTEEDAKDISRKINKAMAQRFGAA